MKQKVYDCLLQLNQFHQVPLTKVTRNEVKLLAFIHGNDAIPQERIKYRGEEEVFTMFRDDNGLPAKIPVNSEQDEYRRLARKYDLLSEFEGTHRGKMLVEKCFNISLSDFEDSIFEAVDPVAQAEERMLQAELSAQPSTVAVEVGGAAPPVHIPSGASTVALDDIPSFGAPAKEAKEPTVTVTVKTPDSSALAQAFARNAGR